MRGGAGGARALAVPVAVLLLLLAVAGTSRTRLFHEGDPPVSAAAARLAIDFSAYLFLAVLLTAAAIIAWALWSGEYSAQAPPRRSLRALIVQMVASAVVLAATVLVLVRLRLHQLQGRSLLPGSAAGNPNPLSPVAPGVPETPAAFDWTAAGLVLLTLALAAAVAARRLRRSYRARSERRTLARELDAVLADSLDDLRDSTEPRLAVIRAYSRMERTLGLHGVARRGPEAPLEYLARALAGLEVPAADAERLTHLFEEARFSDHSVSPAMRDEAVGCLDNVRSALAT